MVVSRPASKGGTMSQRKPVTSVHFWASDKSVAFIRGERYRNYDGVSFSSRRRLSNLAEEKYFTEKWYVRPSLYGWIAYPGAGENNG